jgi:Rrf2 family protein
MKITKAADYAVRCVLYLSGAQKGQVVGRREIAEQMDIPSPFLGKIAQQLARASIIEIVQGAKGGYRLLRPPEYVTLLEVIEAVMGQIAINECMVHEGACARTSGCAVHHVWQDIRKDIRDRLDGTNMAELASRETRSARID